MKPGDGGRLAHWRAQEKEIGQMLDDLPINSIGIASLEKALAVATEMVVHYEAMATKGDTQTRPDN